MTVPEDSVTRNRGRQTVSLTPSPGQDDDSLEADFTRSFAHGERMVERGVQEYRSQIRRVGPVKVMWSKEVGPPPWRWPQVHGGARHRPLFLSIGVGWRSTLYSLHVMWSRS